MLLLASLAWADPFVSPERAAELVASGARILDTRSWLSYTVDGHIVGAVRADWHGAAHGGLKSGTLGDPKVAAAYYAELGVDTDRAVLVVGAWDEGWGEEGRVAWDLLYLGHPDVYVLRGGMKAWDQKKAYIPDVPAMGHFEPEPHAQYRVDRTHIITTDQVQPIVLDVREPDEFAGARKYGEARGGHIPGATNRPWKSFLGIDSDDYAPVSPDSDVPIVVYCTGGVRSAMVAIALMDEGFVDVRNYDGGWWDWSANVTEPPHSAE